MTSRRVGLPNGFYTPLFCVALGFIVMMTGCSPRTVREAEIPLVFSTADGFDLAGTIRGASLENAPGLILVHMLGTDRHRWAHFAALADQAGYMSLAYDIRGHGDSRNRGGDAVDFRSFDQKDWALAVGDIEAAKEALLAAGADPENIAIVGASIGANLALIYAKDDPQIQAVVMLSPGETYHGLEIVSVMEQFRRRPVLIISAEGDTYSASSSAKLKEAAPGFSELRMFAGSAHGTDLLDARDDVSGQILFWLRAVFDGESARAPS